MRKILLLILVILSLMLFFNSKNNNVKIPDSAIRFRILANSNSPRDQKIKQDISKKMQKELYNVLKDSRDISTARSIINSNMTNFEKILDNEMKNYDYSYNIDYGIHHFPLKVYKGVEYPEGDYESLLISLGEGKGDNWWCVLFPPLCVMEAEESSSSDVEYKFFFKEIIEKYFK